MSDKADGVWTAAFDDSDSLAGLQARISDCGDFSENPIAEVYGGTEGEIRDRANLICSAVNSLQSPAGTGIVLQDPKGRYCWETLRVGEYETEAEFRLDANAILRRMSHTLGTHVGELKSSGFRVVRVKLVPVED